MRYTTHLSLGCLSTLCLVCCLTAAEPELAEPRALDAPIANSTALPEISSGTIDTAQIPAVSDARAAIQKTENIVPQTDASGRVRGSSVTDRLQAIRRRAVDDDISRPFLVSGETDNQTIELHGALPEVQRREIVSRREISVEGPKFEQPIGVPKTTPTLSFQQTLAPQIDIQPQPVVVPAQPEPVVVPVQPEPVVVETEPAVVETPFNFQTAPLPSELATQPEPNSERAPTKDLLLSRRAPSLSFETTGPKVIKVGQRSTYRVSMLNLGSDDAQNVVVTVKLPAWAEVSADRASVGGSKTEIDESQGSIIRWKIAHLAANGKEDLFLDITPRDSRPFDLGVGWTFAPGHSLTQIEVQEAKLEMSISGAKETLYGETSIYTISLSNPGTGDADNVVLSLLPIASRDSDAGRREIGTLKAGERRNIELELTAHQAGRLHVKALAHADGGLRTESEHNVTVRRPNLEIVVLGPPRSYAGTPSTYRIRVTNTGDASASDAFAIANIPADSKYVSSNEGGNFDNRTGRIEWQLGRMESGSSRVLEFECELLSAGENRFDIQAQSSQNISVTKSVVTEVQALADLKLYVNDPKGAVGVGEASEYEVKIVNRGTKTAHDIQIVGYFSDGIEPVSVRGWRGEVTTGQVSFEPVEALTAGQELVFRIRAKATQAGNHVFRAEVTCASPETRLAAEEWTRYFGSANGAQQANHQQIQQGGPSLR